MAASRKFPCNDRLRVLASECLGRYIKTSDELVLALSGGVDSVVLLHLLRSLGRPFTAIHVNHRLSQDAGKWAQFCQTLCRSLSVPLRVAVVEVETGSRDGLEAAARRARHAVLQESKADWILLAHHRDDRAETLLFNLMRGTGVRGLAAMPERRGRLVRPLIQAGREDILQYAKAHSLDWVEDGSNSDSRFTRNFLRHQVIPLLQQRFPSVSSGLANAAQRFDEARQLLDDLARLDLAGHAPNFPLPVQLLRDLDESRARNVLQLVLSNHGVGIPSQDRLVEAVRQLVHASPDRKPKISFGEFKLERDKDVVRLSGATGVAGGR